MSQRKTFPYRAPLLCSLILGGLAIGLSGAEAREHGRAARPNDFYAYAGGGDHVAAPSALTRGGCFSTNTPAEAARGIRHWSGDC